MKLIADIYALMQRYIVGNPNEPNNENPGAPESPLLFLTEDQASTEQLLAATAIQRHWRESRKREQVSAEELEKLQHSYCAMNFSDFNVNPPTAQAQQLDEVAKANYLKRINSDAHRDSLDKIISHHIQHISMRDLQKALFRVVKQVNLWLAKHPDIKEYHLLVAKKQSQGWMAQLAARHLRRLPNRIVSLERTNTPTPTLPSKYSHSLTAESALMIFDDCAYSGKQLASTIQGIINHFLRNPPQHKITVIFAITYMTSSSYNKCKNLLKFLTEIDGGDFNYNVALSEANKAKQLGIDNIFHGYELQKQCPNLLRCLSERLRFKIFNPRVMATIKQLPIPETDLQNFTDVCGLSKIHSGSALVYCDWKKPDFVSMPIFFSEGVIRHEYDSLTGRSNSRQRNQPPSFVGSARF